jgi:hypothetical protein
MPTTMNSLTSSQREVCTYTGVFGILLSATCLIQHFVIVAEYNWITILLMTAYVFSGLAFSLLISQHYIAPILLIINSAALMTSSLVLLFNGLFSLIVILMYIYTSIIMTFVYLEGYPAKFWENTLILRAERNQWRDKI